MRSLVRHALPFVAALLNGPLLASAQADTCLGEPCPYTAQSTIGQSGGGVLRFPQAVAVGPDGNVYVGDQSSHIVQVFDPQGSFVRQFGTPGSRPGELTAVSSITVAPEGFVFLTDGGSDRVVVFTATGALYRSFGGRGTGVGEFHFGKGGGNDSPAGGGIHYYKGWVYIADSLNDRVQRMWLDGTQQQIFIPTGQVANPRGVAARGDQVVIADDKNHRLAVYRSDGVFLRSVGLGQGAGPGQLNFPFGVAMDTRNRVFVADDMNQRVVRFDGPPTYRYRSRWGSYGTGPGQLSYPRAIATDEQGLVYVTNTGNDRIDVFTNTGRLVRSFGTSGRGPGQFNTPAGVAADRSGIRAVADSINGRVQLLNPDGSIASIWGSPNPGPTILRRPVDVVFDDAGNGYVLDQHRGRIVRFDRATALPGQTIGAIGNGPGQLMDPSALARSADGRLWVADTGNLRVVRFGPDGTELGSFPVGETPRGIAVAPDASRIYVSTTSHRVLIFDADGKQTGRFGYGPGSRLGQLSTPADLSLDAAGTIWIADRGNSRIAHFDADGKRLGTFGSRGSGDGQFSAPTDVAVDCRGTLTVSDTRNNVVRAFTLAAPAPGSACTALPAPGAPPPLQRATLPEPDGPLITATQLRTTDLLRRGVAVKVGCDTTCTLLASGSLSQQGLPPRRAGRRRVPVSIQLIAQTKQVEAGRTRTFRLVPTAASRRRLTAALGRQTRVVAAVAFEATAAAGDTTSSTLRIPGRR